MKLPIKLHQRLDSGTAIGRRRRWTAEAKPAAGPIYLRTETGGVQRDYCLSEQDRVSLLEAVPAAAPIVSFSDQDRCLLVPPTAFRRTVARTIARSFGETTRHIRARRDTAVFATPASRLQGLEQPVMPGVAVLHALLKTRRPTQLPAVVGFAVGDPQDTLLIQFVLDEAGQLDRLQVVPRISQDSIARTLRSFASGAKIAIKGADRELSDAQVMIFTSEELRGALARVPAYPRTGDVVGIPSTTVRWLAQAAAGAACCALIAWSGWQAWQVKRLSQQLAVSQAMVAHSLDAIRTLARTRFDAFTALASIDSTPALARAARLVVPGGHVDIQIDRERGMTLTTHVPLGDDPRQVRLPAPLGAPCHEAPPAITSTLSEIDLTYACPTVSDAALGAMFRARR
ncbi:hypothetical protein [Pandoraea sp.]|uniref:hypothetical protein n=1 Tax=Pandoraea sp. TaxID=1883445 RepID=UPI0011FDC526|nr:hypothetical protein [Pandoraea sp.]TAL56916.1 MAG: hypothetical protein EPN80_01835 [Pandoraea sp.]TAM17710.1 MAG: hypothetical protein EPN65_09835 [Pandoraea sp.]